ncbi:MAG: two-component regulator propeller domain-containing protein, partial [Huintestinicola sp.]
MKPDKKNISFGKAVIIVILCSAINFLGKYIASLASLPLWLDTSGTFAAAYFTGPIGAVVSGALSNLIFGITVNSSSVLYMVTNAITGLFYCICTSKGRCEKFTGVMMCSFFAGLLSAFASFDINIFTCGGRCGNFWGDTLFDMLQWYGLPKFVSAFAGEAVIDMVDKPVSMALGFLLVAIFKAVFFSKKNPRKKSPKSGASAAAALFIASSMVMSLAPADVSAEVSSKNYVSTVFDSRNGLISSEANAIAETNDGYIWIGSYAGLSRYDGRRFEFIRTGGITSVKALFVDSNGYLWIGTNDKGVALYRNNEFTFFDTSDGLPSNSIRAFAELPDGSICVATTGNMCRIYPDDTIKSSASNIPYVTSLTVCDGKLFGINNSGLLFVLHSDGTLIEKEADDGYYSCVEANDGVVRAGTSAGTVEIVKEENGKIVVLTSRSTAPLKHIISIDTDSKGRRWISADNGFGYINSSGELIIKSTNGFDGSVEQVHEDYQGNIWAASSRYGIIKLSENIFSDLFSADSITGAVCNSVCILDGRIYCATDTGLIMLSETSKKQLTNDLTKLLEGIRIRNITVDGDTLWLSTYSDLGLVRYESDGTITLFNAEEKGTVCNRFRNSYVLSDGTLAAGTVDGINFIRDGRVTGSITMEDGLENSVILCIVEDENNNIYACTDGAGIYVIKDGKIVKNIGTDEGLSSGVVMRLIPYDGGFFAVTTNSLCYMKDDIAVNLENFPYYNNYDVIIKENKACIFSSAGIFVTDAAPLAAGEEISYKLYNINDGLLYGLTANSWSCTDSAGNICFCTNNGILSFDPLSVSNVNTEYIMGISSVRDGDREFKEENSLYIIPADCKRISIEASLRNYSLSNPMVRFFIKEVEDFPQAMLSTELEPIQITNLKYGVYTVCLQVLDDSGKVSSERC